MKGRRDRKGDRGILDRTPAEGSNKINGIGGGKFRQEGHEGHEGEFWTELTELPN
jgi:hypothetical protein